MDIVTSIALIIMGFIPSLVWLYIFLRKDPTPEPKILIIRTFLLGILIAPIVVILQLSVKQLTMNVPMFYFLSGTLIFLGWSAFVEEYMKYWVVKKTVLKNPSFDEPLDGIEYMICSALGFAAIENVLVMFQAISQGGEAALTVWALRFVGATLLHALASSIVGYVLGFGWFSAKHKKILMFVGIILASGVHWAFNAIIYLEPQKNVGHTLILLSVVGIGIAYLFNRLRKRCFEGFSSTVS